MEKNDAQVNSYSKDYRKLLGFTKQNDAKIFFGAKDITPGIDYTYIDNINHRLADMVDKIHATVNKTIQIDDLVGFKNLYIFRPFEIMRDSDILPSLNNQGRRPEQVYFSWMRGYIVTGYFLKALGHIFDTDTTNIELIGDDDLLNEKTFSRTPKADLEIKTPAGKKVRIEVQSGFTGINDIKKHKISEAKRILNELGVHTIIVHFDLYNGQTAFVQADQISDADVNWVARPQMEGQTVFSIDQKYFIWNLIEIPPKYCEWTKKLK